MYVFSMELVSCNPSDVWFLRWLLDFWKKFRALSFNNVPSHTTIAFRVCTSVHLHKFKWINRLDAAINYTFIVCRLDTSQHVSGIFKPIIRSLSTAAAAASGLPIVIRDNVLWTYSWRKNKGHSFTIFTVIIHLIQSFWYLRLQLSKLYVQLRVITCVTLS
jgi:hypothetical protein